MRVRLLALFSAALLFLLGAVPAQAEGEGGNHDNGNGSYLALGDSVPFGFNPLVNAKDEDNFVGYPEIVAETLDLKDVNATCPGEATGGFLSLTGTDNVCRPYRFVLKNPLHVRYSGTQMAFALSYLRHHHNTRLVTLTLGANDFFHLQKVCAASYPDDPNAIAACVGAGIPALLATMSANLNTILGTIRSTGYNGLIVGVTYYSLAYPDTSGADLLNGPMIGAAAAYGGLIASGVEAWRATAMAAGGSSCTARLLILLPPGHVPPCDVHPTPLGRDLLAGAVIQTIAASCPEHDAQGCLDRDHND